jgi:hypothetical protein
MRRAIAFAFLLGCAPDEPPGGNHDGGTDGVPAVDAPAVIPGLGAHVLYTQDESLGTNPATSPAITTQASGSSLVAFSMGWNNNFAGPGDSFVNTWTQISDMNIYAGGNFYTAVWAVEAAAGGAGHTLSFAKPEHPTGEISMGLIEGLDGGDVSITFRLAPENDPTPGTITTRGPATLVAIWGGDSFELSHTATPDNGFAVIDAYLDLGPTSAVQVAVAARQVDAAGTYTVNWTATPAQRCACYLLAIEPSAP